MTKIGIDLYFPDAEFLPLACPHCGAVQNLSLAVTDFWDCDSCGKGFWISLARVVTLDEPGFARVVFEAPDSEALRMK